MLHLADPNRKFKLILSYQALLILKTAPSQNKMKQQQLMAHNLIVVKLPIVQSQKINLKIKTKIKIAMLSKNLLQKQKVYLMLILVRSQHFF